MACICMFNKLIANAMKKSKLVQYLHISFLALIMYVYFQNSKVSKTYGKKKKKSILLTAFMNSNTKHTNKQNQSSDYSTQFIRHYDEIK